MDGAALFEDVRVRRSPPADDRTVFLCSSTICGSEPKLNSTPSASFLCLLSFYCDEQRVENGTGPQWRKISKSFPNNLQAGGMLISPSEKFHGDVETVSGTSRWKENSCCPGVLLFGRGFPQNQRYANAGDLP
ncbi:hypothetical protein CDAR_423681 [Caerostris darwini]|uniref:Uncharacterized protein n=1 Tax=Caerostris darwini TaxID=1538125 RepID=A0AAV4VAK7_9ARAC|nr:hypothetical protein CDAR_423681 [Caerostris darwini]